MRRLALVLLVGGGAWSAAAAPRPMARPAQRSVALMARLGFTPNDRVTGFFSIEIELRPLATPPDGSP